jgi:hypothetical protein
MARYSNKKQDIEICIDRSYKEINTNITNDTWIGIRFR